MPVTLSAGLQKRAKYASDRRSLWTTAASIPAWIKEQVAVGNAKPYVVWNLGLDPSDPHDWAWAVSERLVPMPSGEMFEPSPWPRLPQSE